MKTFFNLMQDVIKRGLCHRCGACVTLCTTVNYGALELDEQGRPRYRDIDKCIECGLCYSICPEIHELEEETKQRLGWSAPIGRVLGVSIARAKDPQIRERATDGGVVTALLLHLFDTGHIDGAIVTKQTGPFQRDPVLATSKEEVLEGAGFFFDTSHGMVGLGDAYLAHASVEALNPLMKKGLRRVALVGTPCQIEAFRRMETLGVMPSDSVAFCFGLFCSGNFVLGEEQRRKLAQIGGFSWDEVHKVNVKEHFLVQLQNGEIKQLDLELLAGMKRSACRYCDDYSSEFADISFGGIGSPQGWTTVILRTPKGRAAFADARGVSVEEFDRRQEPGFPDRVLDVVIQAAAAKRRKAQAHHEELGKPVRIKG